MNAVTFACVKQTLLQCMLLWSWDSVQLHWSQDLVNIRSQCVVYICTIRLQWGVVSVPN